MSSLESCLGKLKGKKLKGSSGGGRVWGQFCRISQDTKSTKCKRWWVLGETGESPRVSFSCKITASRAAKSNHTTHTANSSSASDTTASKCFTLWTRSNCCAALLSVQIKPSHDSPDHLCLHPKQKHCKPSPTVIFLLLENIHSRVSFFRQFNRSVIFICISKYVQTTPHINVSK